MKIILTGAESSGKSTLGKALAQYFQGKYIEEYARKYVENLARNYTYKDVLHIANVQKTELQKHYTEDKIFFDTGLIITKVWFQECFFQVPNFLKDTNYIRQDYLYLLCKPNLPWVKDGVRENAGKKRTYLYKKYLKALQDSKCNFKIIDKKGEARLKQAIAYIKGNQKNIENLY